jgi:hypothetical protein
MCRFLAGPWTLALLAQLACIGPGVPVLAQTQPPATNQGSDPPAEVQSEYRDVVARAIAEFEAGRWAEARSLFLRAHALWPSARTWRSLGMTSFELRSYGRALIELQAALDDARRPLSDAHRAQVASLIEQTRAFVGRYRVRLSPAHATLLVDDAPRALPSDGALLLGVGRHELLARADGYGELRRTLEVEGIEDEELTLALQPMAPLTAQASLPAPAPATSPASGSSAAPADAPDRAPGAATGDAGAPRTWTWVAAGAAVVLGAASAALWLESKAQFDDLAAKCRVETCVRGELDTSSVEVPETAHQITLGLAVGAGVSAIALFFIEGREEPSPRAGVSMGPGTLSVHGRF